MSLRAKIANTIKTDSKGYAIAEIADITFISKDESEFENSSDQVQFDFLCDGLISPILLKIWTGLNLNAEKYNNGKKEEFNKFTKICTNLGLITIKEIAELQKTGKEPDIDIESLKGIKVKYKPTKNLKTKGLSTIDLDTLEVVEQK